MLVPKSASIYLFSPRILSLFHAALTCQGELFSCWALRMSLMGLRASPSHPYIHDQWLANGSIHGILWGHGTQSESSRKQENSWILLRKDSLSLKWKLPEEKISSPILCTLCTHSKLWTQQCEKEWRQFLTDHDTSKHIFLML